jgi:quercetin dioxygenase-like cupin family protein
MSTTEGASSGANEKRVQQAPGLWRTSLQQHDLSVAGREVVQQRVEIGPEAPVVKHTHPGEESSTSWRARWNIRSRASRRERATPVTP